MVKCLLNIGAKNRIKSNGYLWVIDFKSSSFTKCARLKFLCKISIGLKFICVCGQLENTPLGHENNRIFSDSKEEYVTYSELVV